jgi:RNA polymerase sigma factor (sigma-70 family)
VDVLRETLLAIGRIPMLTAVEEERLARGIEAAKGRWRRSMLRFAPVVSQVASLLDRIVAGEERLDRALDVTLADLKNKERLLEVARMHAATLRGILSESNSPLAIASDAAELSELAAEPLTERQTLKVQRLVDEAHVRTSQIEGFFRTAVLDVHLSGALLRRYHLTRERYESLRNRMVAANLRLAVSIAKKYQHAGVPLLDLIQEGSEGLIRAAEKFRPALGFKFSTYSVWWIQQRVRSAVSEKARLIRVGDGAAGRIKQLRLAAAGEEGQAPQTLSFEDLPLPPSTPARREELRKSFYACRDVLSLDLPLQSGSQMTHAEAITSDPVDFDGGLIQAEQRQAIGSALAGLTARECQVLRLRFGLEDGQERNLAEVGRTLGISRERVRQIEVASLQKLRQRLASEHVD